MYTVLYVCPLPYLPHAVLIYIRRRRGLASRASKAVFVLILVNFCLNTMYWASWVSAFILQIRTAFVNNVDLQLNQKLALANQATLQPDAVLGWSGFFHVRFFHMSYATILHRSRFHR